jgi:hypothetical protein
MDIGNRGSMEIRVEARVLHPEVVQEGQEVRGARVVREAQSEVLRGMRRVVVVWAGQEGQEAAAQDTVGELDPRMEVACLRQVVQALGQLHQRREQEGLRTGQGSEGRNLRNSGQSTGHPRKGHRDILGTVRRRGQHAVPVRLEAPGKEGL